MALSQALLFTHLPCDLRQLDLVAQAVDDVQDAEYLANGKGTRSREA